MTSQASAVLCVAAVFIWLGMVLAISFLEAPVKFRAPGVTLGLGLGIGRLVFRGLNFVECVLVVLLVAAGMGADLPGTAWFLIPVPAAVLAIQVLVLRRPLDRRARRIIAGGDLPPSRIHLAYIALEVLKVIALSVLGASVAGWIQP